MKYLMVILILTVGHLISGCEDIDNQIDDSPESPFIGNWIHQSSVGSLEVVSSISQQTSDYTRETIGGIEVSGSHNLTLNHFFRAVPIMGGCPFYLISDEQYWNSPNAELSLYDSCEALTDSIDYKSLTFSYGSNRYHADSIYFSYDKISGNMEIPRTVLHDSALDSVVVEGSLVVPMIELPALETVQVLYMDVDELYEYPQEYRFLSNDSLMLVYDSTSTDTKLLPWSQLDDSLQIFEDSTQMKYHFLIDTDTLYLTTERAPDNNLLLLEAWGDLESNTLTEAWWRVMSVYTRSN